MEFSRGRRDQRNLWDKTWKDKQGNVVIWQFPNAALWTWVVATVLSLLFNGTVANLFSWVGSAALIVWSLLEIFRGANYFRQLLGVLVLIAAIATVIKAL